MTPTTPAEVLAELADLEDPRIREVNTRHGDDHAVNLTALRAVAKRLTGRRDLVRPLWETGDSAARLLAILICRPKEFEPAELDGMLREARTPKVHDWLVNRARTPRSCAWTGRPIRTRSSRVPAGR